MSKKLEPEERERRKKARDRAYYLKHYDQNKKRYRSHAETWRKENPDASKAIDKRHRAKLRQEVIEAYGGKCVCCGIDDWRFLSIDHTNNDGASHRKDKRFRGPSIYGWLKANGFPKDRFQVLCYNCNLAKAHCGGVCPHQIKPNSVSRTKTA